jgi:small subunit ribosomal protein S14
MKRGVKNITKDNIKKLHFVKQEWKKLILKSILQNKNIKPLIRSYCFYKLVNLKKKSSISNQNNPCLIRGRFKGVYKKFGLCRHVINKLALNGNLQNTKIKSW